MIDNPYYPRDHTHNSKDRHIIPDVIMRSYPSGPPLINIFYEIKNTALATNVVSAVFEFRRVLCEDILNGEMKILMDFFDLFCVILDKLKFCAGHQSVVGTG